MVCILLETLSAVSTKTEHMCVQWPHSSFLGEEHPAKMDTYVHQTILKISIAAGFVIAPNWELLKCSSNDKNYVCYSHIMNITENDLQLTTHNNNES